jgi:uncharacterized protein (DUF1501 family)
LEEYSDQRLLSRLGASRQKFLATLGSFDTHMNQLNEQQALLSQLDAGLTAFHDAMADSDAGKNLPRSRCRIFRATSCRTPAAERTN